MKIPAYDVPENISDADIAFGARRPVFFAGNLGWDEAKKATYDIRHSDELRPFCQIANSFFFRGGRLSDHHLKWKDGLDWKKYHSFLQSLMASFDVSHEQKEASVALLLYHHTEKC